jgi:hypothetical protein
VQITAPAHSGAVYDGAPQKPAACGGCAATHEAMPKSVMRGTSSPVRMMLPGSSVRCTTPFRCAAPSAFRSWIVIASARSMSMRCSTFNVSESALPSTWS